jgi:hypothetical protein
MYQQINDTLTGQPAKCVKRLADNAFIPFDPDNTDYAEYLKWVEAGNAPIGADEPATADTPSE